MYNVVNSSYSDTITLQRSKILTNNYYSAICDLVKSVVKSDIIAL